MRDPTNKARIAPGILIARSARNPAAGGTTRDVDAVIRQGTIAAADLDALSSAA